MTRKSRLTFLLIITSVTLFGQSKMVVGRKHTIFVNIPKNWLQAQNDQLPFFIKPNEKNVSNKTYMYVYGLDYTASPKLEDWIEGNNKDVLISSDSVKIDTLNIEFSNIKKDDYLTGRYKTITYQYKDNRKEVLLIIECKNTIATVVLSAGDNLEFDKRFTSFKELSNSFRILGTTMKED